jgi:hypothetical protein
MWTGGTEACLCARTYSVSVVPVPELRLRKSGALGAALAIAGPEQP